MWLVLMVLPVVPLLATPHAGYINGVAFAVAVALGPGLGKRARPIWIGTTSRYVAGFFLVATCSYIPIYRALWTGVVAAERYTTAAMTVDRPPPEVTDVFCINLPFVNIYQQVCLDEAWGPAAVRRTHVLTYAPGLLRMEQPCVVEQLDEHRFSVTLVGGRSYFSGALGRFLVDAMRTSGRFRPGEVIAGERFEVTIAETDADGVRKLIFRFHEPLASERYHFFLTTPVNGASRVRFHQRGWTPESQETLATTPQSRHAVAIASRQLRSGQAGAAETLFAAARANDPEARRAAREALQTVGRVVAGATGAAVQAILAADDPSPEQWGRIRAWWQLEVDDRTLAEVWTHRDDFSALRDTRDALFGIRSIAKKVIRTDLYLTGPPFPGPR